MGREARCACRWGDRRGDVKVLLEAHELIVRDAVRMRVPLSELRDVHVADDRLRFHAFGEPVELELGREAALRWARALQTPPPSLAHKLGITPESRVVFVGAMDDPELAAALNAGTPISENPTVFVVRADQTADIAAALATHASPLRGRVPLWIVYVKGRGPFGETAIRAFMISRGFIDTKVASVSARLTALRFIIRAPS